MTTRTPRGPSATVVVVLLALAGLAALLVGNLLTGGQQAAPADAAAPTFTETRDANGNRLTLTIDPARAGQATFRVQVQRADGSPVRDAQAVTLTLVFLEHPTGAPILKALPTPDGSYEVIANSIAIPGRWQVGVQVQGGSAADASASYLALIAPRALPPQEQSWFPYHVDLRNFGLNTLIGLELAIAGFVIILAAKWFVPARQQRRTGQGLGAAGMLVGGYLAASSLLTPFAASELYRNPTPGDAQSVVRGRPVYQQNCASCHGAAGRGDGPNAAGLNPPPADLAGGHILSHTDEDLYNWATNGIDGTAMPAFKDRLTADQRWDVVNFIRSLTVATQ